MFKRLSPCCTRPARYELSIFGASALSMSAVSLRSSGTRRSSSSRARFITCSYRPSYVICVLLFCGYPIRILQCTPNLCDLQVFQERGWRHRATLASSRVPSSGGATRDSCISRLRLSGKLRSPLWTALREKPCGYRKDQRDNHKRDKGNGKGGRLYSEEHGANV